MISEENTESEMSRADDKGVEKIDDKAGIHSADSARHLERPQKKSSL